jgi:DNA-binding CsgD family transcriptional regulator/tetratricopeptide (TPR) repeat protein
MAGDRGPTHDRAGEATTGDATAGSGALARGRRAFAERAWAEAHAQLAEADRGTPLDHADLERLAVAAYLVGRDADSQALWARVHHERAAGGDPAGAARAAFWLGFGLLMGGDVAQAGGWLARARRVLEQGPADCVEHGYLLMPQAMEHLFGGAPETAHPLFLAAITTAERCHDPDLQAFGRLGAGQSLVFQGRTAEGTALLDEAMVAVTAGDVSPMLAGLIYCAVIETCREVFDVRRAHEWTEALTRWCDAQPDLVPYRGQCLVHRAEILQLRGAWIDALDEARRACERLEGAPAAGAAHYQRAELHRLRGEHDAAEEAYRQAMRAGHPAQPGLALLRLAQGHTEAAAGAIRRLLGETTVTPLRVPVLAAAVDIALATGDVGAARAHADELAAIAAALDAPVLHAMSARATGAVLLAERDGAAALAVLRRAWTIWRDADAPYEAARVRLLVALACESVGDPDSAAMERDAARDAFARLGATPELARLDAPPAPAAASAPPSATAGLTARELEVLTLVARGRTNREIAAALVISEHTVARHVQNILTKLGVSSRTAAGAFAHEHHLVTGQN